MLFRSSATDQLVLDMEQSDWSPGGNRLNQSRVGQDPAPRPFSKRVASDFVNRHAIHRLDHSDQGAERELPPGRQAGQEACEVVSHVPPGFAGVEDQGPRECVRRARFSIVFPSCRIAQAHD